MLELQGRVLAHLKGGGSGTAEAIAAAVGAPEAAETILHVLRHLAANGRGVEASVAKSPFEQSFRLAQAR